jgi:hypothetical protein
MCRDLMFFVSGDELRYAPAFCVRQSNHKLRYLYFTVQRIKYSALALTLTVKVPSVAGRRFRKRHVRLTTNAAR